jgi:HK97 family phage major capsid protein
MEETQDAERVTQKKGQLEAGLSIANLRDALLEEIRKGQNANTERVTELQAQISEAHEKLNALTKSRSAGGPGLGLGIHAEDMKRLSLCKMLDGHLNGWDKVKNSELERELCMETQRKAQEAGQDTAGGFLVPTEFMSDMLIPLLEANTIAIQLGFRGRGDLHVAAHLRSDPVRAARSRFAGADHQPPAASDLDAR